MARYAEFADVQARAGRFAGVFSVAGKKPGQTEIEAILDDLGAELEALIEARGFAPASLDAGAKAALKDLSAYGALARALPAAVPGKDAKELIETAADLYAAGLKSISEGKHPVILNLEAGKGAGKGPSGGDFWEENPTYGSEEQIKADAETLTKSLAPGFERHMTL